MEGGSARSDHYEARPERSCCNPGEVHSEAHGWRVGGQQTSENVILVLNNASAMKWRTAIE
jgi:hypothetical protein